MQETKPVIPPPVTLPIPKPAQYIVYWIAGLSLCLGIIGNNLLRAKPLGINISIFVVLLCLVIAWGWRRHKEYAPCWGLLCLAVVFGLCLAWRDSSVLCSLNLITIIILLMVLGMRPAYKTLYTGTLASIMTSVIRQIGPTLCSPLILLVHDIDWSLVKIPSGSIHKRFMRSLMLAIPILLIFTWLFAAADAVFQHGVNTIISNISNIIINSHELTMHILFSLLFSLMAAMALRPITLGDVFEPVRKIPPKKYIPGKIELTVVMGSILILFITFIVIQFRYLFGGHTLVQSIPGLTYADYARKGFFALLAVVTIVHLILMVGLWLVESTNARTKILFRQLSLALAVLCIFIFVSAFFRMSLYIKAYGLTQLRFYATAILIWLAAAFLLSTAKCLLPGWSFFTGAYIYSLLVMLLIINIVNPDGLIARINLDRYVTRKKLDTAYLETLSTDAVPVIMCYQKQFTPKESRILVNNIIKKRITSKTDWRCWNYSRIKTKKLGIAVGTEIQNQE